VSISGSLSLIPRARAVGPDGEVICTDGDPEIATLAEDYLSTAGMWDRMRYRGWRLLIEPLTSEGAKVYPSFPARQLSGVGYHELELAACRAG
jgi:hypothetical protein